MVSPAPAVSCQASPCMLLMYYVNAKLASGMLACPHEEAVHRCSSVGSQSN